jgi:hypothetical protein
MNQRPVRTREKDPRQLPVQLNITIPWAFKEYLIEVAEKNQMGLAQVVRKALDNEYGPGYTRSETARVRTS